MLKLLFAAIMLIASQALLLMGHGLQLTLLPLRAALDGFTLTEIGLTGTAYFVGFACGCVGTPLIARRAGHIRTFAILASTASAVILVFPLSAQIAPWLLLRFATGWCIAGLYALIESWLNERASNENRGSVMAFYTLTNLSMIAVGQGLVNVAEVGSGVLFTVASLLFSLSVIPVALSRTAPAPIRSVRIDLRRLWQTSHVACTGSLLAGMATGAFWSLAPVYASSAGLSTAQITGFVAAAVGGGALAQLPLGRWSDRYDRRLVLMVAAGLAILPSAVLTVPALLTPAALVALAAVFGAFAMPLYALSVAHANDRAEGQDFVIIGSGVLLLFGAGSALGAPMAGYLMSTAMGSSALFGFVGVVLAILILGVAWRRRVRAAPTQEPSDQPFIAVSELTPIALDLDPRAQRTEEAS